MVLPRHEGHTHLQGKSESVLRIGNRYTIIADGPVTLVPASRATAAERGRALGRMQAQGLLWRAGRGDEGGDRHDLVGIYELLTAETPSYLCDLPTSFFARHVVDAASDGRLLVVPGWGWHESQEPADNAAAATPAASTKELSGAAWVSRFPGSSSTDDLDRSFKDNVSLINALTAAAAQISISATLRPPERAYLMHYSFKVANSVIAAKNVPAMDGVDINWEHPTDAASIAAAREMVQGYGIVYAPALTSRHTEGKAIDMTISWTGTLKIAKKDGTEVSISASPRTGDNTQLHNVGASYGVHKLATDPPHWSSDGH